MSALIPPFDLSRETADQIDALQAALHRVLQSGHLIMGAEHDAFEAEFARAVGASGAVGVANGTDALEIALAVVGVSAGDLVLTVANAGGYTSIAAYRLGARPVFCDVDDRDLLMSAETLRAALATASVRPAAIVVTHLFGAMADMPAIMAIAREWAIPVVEDCAQSIGARWQGQHCGTFGDIAVTSFYPTKNLGGFGDGGAIFSMNPELLDRARVARQYGWTSKYTVEASYGRNSRLDELQAALLRVKLEQFDARMAQRRDIFAHYEAAAPTLVVNRSSESFAPHLAVLRVADRDRVHAHFRDAGIGTTIHYPVLDHRQPAWLAADVTLPVSERAVTEIVSIPMFPTMRDDEVERVCTALTQIAAGQHGDR